jgi:isoquinoline 1-oxidoreductase subunit alpha
LSLNVNGRNVPVNADPSTPLLWVLRDELNLIGTKYGCGIMTCGACTVHVDGAAQRSCLLPVSAVQGKRVITIEGVAVQGSAGDVARAVQAAWVKHQVPQCGYCQSGFVMATVALLNSNAKPSDAQIDTALTNLCRCGTYDAMRAAIHDAAAMLAAR